MVFSSPYFVFLFLPLALVVGYSFRHIAYLHALLAVSVLFYYWSAGYDTLVLIGLIVGNFLAAKYLVRGSGRALFALLICANLAILFWFKYASFVAQNVDTLLGTRLALLCGEVVLPAGVSFFVFQAVSYLVDVRRGELPAERSLVTYGAYQAFFPHLIAGPIVRYRDVVADLLAPRFSVGFFAAGVSRFSHGLLKKVLVADGVAPLANAVFELDPADLRASTAWLGALAYTLQIYFDFSGYSDMALGLAQMFGVRFHENFMRPYSSKSITDFWRRWHISLSSWFRDYLYIPLGGNRGGPVATYRNLLIVFAVTGFWHGAAWSFVAWGLYHGLFLVVERVALGDPAARLRNEAFRYLYCLPVVTFGWVLFRAPSIHATLDMWLAMLGAGAPAARSLSSQVVLSPYALASLALGSLVLVAPGGASLGMRLSDGLTSPAGRLFDFGYAACALALSACVVLSGGYSPFLYFNF